MTPDLQNIHTFLKKPFLFAIFAEEKISVIMRTLISNPTIVNNGEQFRGSIVVNNGKIVEILRENELPRAQCDEIIEATGMYLIPGVI